MSIVITRGIIIGVADMPMSIVTRSIAMNCIMNISKEIELRKRIIWGSFISPIMYTTQNKAMLYSSGRKTCFNGVGIISSPIENSNSIGNF